MDFAKKLGMGQSTEMMGNLTETLIKKPEDFISILAKYSIKIWFYSNKKSPVDFHQETYRALSKYLLPKKPTHFKHRSIKTLSIFIAMTDPKAFFIDLIVYHRS